LYNFKAETQPRSLGSVVEVDTKKDKWNIYFNKKFMALQTCILGFKEVCWPYLSVDSTILLGIWNGYIASVTILEKAQLDVLSVIWPIIVRKREQKMVYEAIA
jgi:hypothetical protein